MKRSENQKWLRDHYVIPLAILLAICVIWQIVIPFVNDCTDISDFKKDMREPELTQSIDAGMSTSLLHGERSTDCPYTTLTQEEAADVCTILAKLDGLRPMRAQQYTEESAMGDHIELNVPFEYTHWVTCYSEYMVIDRAYATCANYDAVYQELVSYLRTLDSDRFQDNIPKMF